MLFPTETSLWDIIFNLFRPVAAPPPPPPKKIVKICGDIYLMKVSFWGAFDGEIIAKTHLTTLFYIIWEYFFSFTSYFNNPNEILRELLAQICWRTIALYGKNADSYAICFLLRASLRRSEPVFCFNFDWLPLFYFIPLHQHLPQSFLLHDGAFQPNLPWDFFA